MPPELEPLRERIKGAMVARLAAMIAGPTYWYTPALVTRKLVEVDQYKAELILGPVLGVVRSIDSTLDEGESVVLVQEGFPLIEGVVLHHFMVDIVAYVLGDGSIKADTQLERVWDDHWRCLRADTSLGALDGVKHLRPQGPMETDRGTWEPHAFFRQPWLVRAIETRAIEPDDVST
jgi:hypothetical protein